MGILICFIVIFCVGVEIGARAAKYNIKHELCVEGKIISGVSIRDPYIDDGDCGSTICFYCGNDILEGRDLEERHEVDCVYRLAREYEK